jgi:hypothetical protein
VVSALLTTIGFFEIILLEWGVFHRLISLQGLEIHDVSH